MDNVQKVVTEKFGKWRKENKRNGTSEEAIEEDMADYMEEAFQINNTENSNILDILNTMVASDVDASVGLNGVRDNVIACNEPDTTDATNDRKEVSTTETRNSRKKREAENSLTKEEFCCEEMKLSIDADAL